MKILLTGIFATELVKYGLWYTKIHGLKLRRSLLSAVMAGLAVILMLAGVVDQDTFLMFFGLAAAVIMGFMADCSGNERGLVMLQALFMIISMGEMTDGIIRLMRGVVWYAPDEMKLYYFINNIIIIFILYAAGFVKKKVKVLGEKKEGRFHRAGMCFTAAVTGVVIFLTVTGFQNIAQYLQEESVGKFSRILSVLSFASIACLVMLISYIVGENKRYKAYLEKDALLLETQKHIYEAMINKNEETRRFRHDIQNHFMCLGQLARHGELDKVQNYIEEMEGNMLTIQNKVYTVGNSVVDAVLNYYTSMLRAEIKVSVSGRCAPGIKMSDVELCTVISNLIQNAEEALNKPQRGEGYLKVEFQNDKGYMRMQMKNSLPEEEIELDTASKLPITTKRHKENHGIGILNVRDTVEKNGGLLNIEVKPDEFVAAIILPAE